jgi:hypothetical protein
MSSAKCYGLTYISSRGTRHYRLGQRDSSRSDIDATRYTKAVAEFLARPEDEVVLLRKRATTTEEEAHDLLRESPDR